jgi:dihydroorotase
LEQASIAEGQDAALSFFDPGGTTLLEAATLRSRSKNNPFLGKRLRGFVVGVLNGERLHLNQVPQ